MIIVNKKNIRHITLQPGEFYVSSEIVVMSTLLGSCISACLYDPVKGIVGMNHFLLSNRKYSRDMPSCMTEAGRYGVQAMELVINGMLKLGANRKSIKAKAFGGSSLLVKPDQVDNFCCVGEVNNRFIMEFLKNDGIPLVACDLGGDRGRTIHFSSRDFSVHVRKTQKTFSPNLMNKERQFWKKTLEDAEKKGTEPEIWI